MIRIEVTINEHSTPADVRKVADWLGKLPEMPWACAEASPSADRFFGEQPDGSIRRKNLPDIPAPDATADTLAALERENPQFGRQPLPPGADPYLAGIAERAAGPLAPSGAPSPAAAEASASAPAAAPASTPPPPPAASAVPSPPPAAATPVPAGAVDAKGLPWDERIHASSRAKIADGSWRVKRGVDPTKVTEVEAELRAQSFQPGTIADPAAYEAAKAAGTIREIQPDAPPAPPAPPLPPAAPELTFGMVAKRVTAKLTLGELTTAELTKRLAELGFPEGLHTVNARPDMWLTVLETLGA